MGFVRFVVSHRDPDSGRRQGVLNAAFDLMDAGALSPEEEAHLKSIEKWFGANLSRPTRFTSKRNDSHRRPRALSWFKDSAHDHILQMQNVVALLRAHDVQTEMIVTDRPGYVVYEDAFQLVAEPFADTGA